MAWGIQDVCNGGGVDDGLLRRVSPDLQQLGFGQFAVVSDVADVIDIPVYQLL